jgi:hypothetical protein
MARRRHKDDISISLVPILSIQNCAMGVMVVIICAQTAVSIARTTETYLKAKEEDQAKKGPAEKPPPTPAPQAADQYLEIVGSAKDRQAVYVECQENAILIHPAKTKVSLENLKGAGPSAFQLLLNDLGANRHKKYLVLLVRPEGTATYQLCESMARKSQLDFGKDALLSGGDVILTRGGQPVVDSQKEVP